MAELSTTVQTETPPVQTDGGSAPAPSATKSGITFISKNGQPVNNQPQSTPDPGADNTGNTPAPTNAEGSTEKKDANPQAPENQGTDAGAVAPATQNDDPNAAAEVPVQPDLLALLADRSGGKITKPEDAVALVDEVTNLRSQLAERPKIEFPNDQARQIYEFAQKFPGFEMGAAKNLLHTQSLSIDKLEPKEVQFEAFALKKPHWTREQARQYFEEKYNKAYGDGILETSTMAQLDHEEETRQARTELTKMQQDFAAAKPSQPAGEQQSPQLTPDQQAEIKRTVEEVTKDFGGVRYQFVKNDANSTVNVQMDKSSLQKFQNYLADPGEFLKDLAVECTENGVFSHVKYRDIMFELANRKQIRDQVFNQGKIYGEISIIKERKNTATPKTSTETPPPATKPTSFRDAMRNAVKGNGVKV